MKLALQPVPRSPGAKTAPPNLSTCAQCPSIDSAIALFPRTAGPYRDLRPASPALQNAMPVSSFRINTCESVSKQRTLTIFRINTYEKQGEGGPVIVNKKSDEGFLSRATIESGGPLFISEKELSPEEPAAVVD